MICGTCGHDNPDRTEFCLACRAFLGWVDQNAPTAGPPAAPVPEPVRPAGGGPPGPQPVGTGSAGSGSAGSGWAGAGSAGVPAGAEPGAAPAGSEQPRATARRPDEQPPEPVQPPPEAPAARLPSGDLYCPECGTGNARTRVLCEHCGARLALPDGGPGAHRPWWRRLLPGRAARQYVAGERPHARRWRRPRFGVPIVVAALVVGLLVARPYLGQFWNYIRDQTATPSAVNPVRESASSAAPGHPAHAAFDGVSNRCWMPNRTGGAANQYLEVNFTPAVRLLKVVVLPGCSPDKNQFVQQGRPSGLRFEVETADHRRPVHRITLADQPGQQAFTLREAAVTTVRIVITGSYGTQPGTRVAIAEIEFYRRA